VSSADLPALIGFAASCPIANPAEEASGPVPTSPRHRRLLAGILIPLAAAATLLLPAAPAAAAPEAGQ
jgi:hypothetical protein